MPPVVEHPFRPLFVDAPLLPTGDLPPPPDVPPPAPAPAPKSTDVTQQEATSFGAIPVRWAVPRRWAAPNYVGASRAVPQRLYVELQWAFAQPSLVEEATMPPPSWGSWPAQAVPHRLGDIAKVMARIDADRVASNWEACPVAEHDPLVDIAVMLLDG